VAVACRARPGVRVANSPSVPIFQGDVEHKGEEGTYQPPSAPAFPVDADDAIDDGEAANQPLLGGSRSHSRDAPLSRKQRRSALVGLWPFCALCLAPCALCLVPCALCVLCVLCVIVAWLTCVVDVPGTVGQPTSEQEESERARRKAEAVRRGRELVAKQKKAQAEAKKKAKQLRKRKGKDETSMEEKQDEAAELLNSMRDLIGLGEDPESSHWLKMYRKDPDGTGKTHMVGSKYTAPCHPCISLCVEKLNFLCCGSLVGWLVGWLVGRVTF